MSPAWSPRRQWIAFDGHPHSGGTGIFVVVGAGRRAPRHPRRARPRLQPRLVRGRLYLLRRRGVRLEGEPRRAGSPVQVTKRGGTRPRISPDGKTLYYVKLASRPEDSGYTIWRLPLGADRGSGDGSLQASRASPRRPLDRGRAGHLLPEPGPAKPRPTVSVFDFKTGEVENVVPIEHEIPHSGNSMAVSPDGHGCSSPSGRTPAATSCWSRTSANGRVIRR